MTVQMSTVVETIDMNKYDSHNSTQPSQSIALHWHILSAWLMDMS